MWSALVALTLGANDVSALVAATKPSIVHVKIRSSMGTDLGNATGFFVSNDGLVATNAHVVDDAAALTVVLSTGEERSALGIVAVDVDHDVALFRVPGVSAPLVLGESASLVEGEPVMHVGSPLGLDFTVSEGIVSAIRAKGLPEEMQRDEDKYFAKMGRVIQISASSASGSSGSPVVRPNGTVIGVLHGGMGGQGSLVFVSPVENLKALIEKSRGAQLTPLSALGSSKTMADAKQRNLIISGVVFLLLAVAGVIVSRSQWAKTFLR